MISNLFLNINICDCSFWICWFFPMLASFLLGWLFGWWETKKLKTEIESLVRDLRECRKRSSDLDLELENYKVQLESSALALKKCKEELKAKPAIASIPLAAVTPAAKKDSPKKKVSPVKRVTDKKRAKPKARKKAAVKKYPAMQDNLQVVEGIGPKMNEILNKEGIKTWAKLNAKKPSELRALLDKFGGRYRIIDPTTWPKQAGLAHSGRWKDLIKLQKQLDTGKTGGSTDTDAKVEKMMIKLGIIKKWKKDDLKAVEGIGPKIEELLKADGIDTWAKLAKTKISVLNKVLEKAGKRYQLADPSTWAQQAKLAAAQKFEDLVTLQAELKGGKR